ncbi:MAG: cytochrome c-type biogenesis protein CcmH [Zoogloeaceae bacterium]|jgi:cytochrome c-type biogenesis protein CcmH|nr:cytochrome c-type biogenesis protein CcmH [Zoogloeaceae bacterium]
MIRPRFFLFLPLCFFALAAVADTARPLAEDPAVEKRVQAIAGQLRCLVCQNETIAASNADLARDLRGEIARMAAENQSDEEILAFMTERYGEFVLYRPPFRAGTWLLWLGPPFFVLLGFWIFSRSLAARNRRLAERNPPDAAALEAAGRLFFTPGNRVEE